MTQTAVTGSGVGVVREQRPRRFQAWAFIVGIAVLALATVASMTFGSRGVSVNEILAGISGDTDSLGSAAVAARMPRSVMAIIVGAMLAIAGSCLQGITRNPISDPGILGISFGAGLAVVVGIAAFGISSPPAFVALAIAGAAMAAVLVYVIGSMGYGGLTPLKLALAGAACAAAFSALTNAVLLPRVDILTTFRHWQVGGVGGAEWSDVVILVPCALFGGTLCMSLAGGLNTLALGDDVAAGLGAHVGRTRLLGWVGAVFLTGAATAIVGPIAFVGLLVTHACRLVVGPDYRRLIPLATVAGAALLLTADVIGRVIARPAEVEVGIVTAVIGAPFFIWIVRRAKVHEL